MPYNILEKNSYSYTVGPIFTKHSSNHRKETGFLLKKTALKSVLPFESNDATDTYTHTRVGG